MALDEVSPFKLALVPVRITYLIISPLTLLLKPLATTLELLDLDECAMLECSLHLATVTFLVLALTIVDVSTLELSFERVAVPRDKLTLTLRLDTIDLTNVYSGLVY